MFSSFYMNFIVVIVLISIRKAFAVNLIAYISQHGLHGEIYFSQLSPSETQIESNVETTLQYPEQVWSWSIYQFPVDYSNGNGMDRCDFSNLGEQLWSFDDEHGYLTLPGNETTKWISQISLSGQKGLWGKSLVLYSGDLNFRICATITTRDASEEHIAEARFNTPFAGSVYFRWLAAKETDHKDTLVYTNLYHLKEQSSKLGDVDHTEHFWKIYATDVFETDASKADENCNKLQLIFDPHNQGKGRSVGDIDIRVGALKIATNPQRQLFRELYNDKTLALSPSDLYGRSRKLYLVVFDPIERETYLGCAKIRHIRPKMAKALVNDGGLKGEIRFMQRSKFEPTWINVTFSSPNNASSSNVQYAKDVASYRINSLPMSPVKANTPNYCQTAGEVFNPLDVSQKATPPPGYGTQDQYPIGDLSGKLLNRNKDERHYFHYPEGITNELSGLYWDAFLPLEGTHTILHRGFSIQKYNRTNPTDIQEQIWACGITAFYEIQKNYQVAMESAQVVIRYPIVTKIIFRQVKDQYWTDTFVIFEYLIHADGSTQNNTFDHRWTINNDPPGKDFYDWQNRCRTAGDVYNPFRVNYPKKKAEDLCQSNSKYLCRFGDLSNRLGLLAIAGNKASGPAISRKMFVDQNLPLSGPGSIFGKSVVIYDDFGPKARGERLACSPIGGYHRRKAVAKDWYSNGDPLTMKGKMEMVQQSEYDITNVEVDFRGLAANSGYHVHVAPVEGDLEFPCEDSTLYGHWNPRNVDPKRSPLPAEGSSDQYELGDLSGKFGTLEGASMFETAYNDSNLPLFGYESIIGRSIVVHKKEKNGRWACSSLERGYSPSEAREIRAIASFHHPAGHAYGYVRLTQLIGSDGSQSDTVIEVKLRHPGKNDRNKTENHNWNIWVNPVGVDATVKQHETRCVAAGYVWNPFYTQLADPLNEELYKKECGPDNPYRCYVGDVSARLGPINLGGRRAVFTDPNFPLEGLVSAVGRSIVIFAPHFSSLRFACANIEPDHDIVKYINLKRPPRFVIAQFLEDVRHVMGLPEWFLAIDSRSVKTLHNGACIQMVVHFKGPQAFRIEQDFAKLLHTGRLDTPTVNIPGYVDQKRKKKLSYQTCGVRDPNEKKSKSTFSFRNNGATRIENRASIVISLMCIAINVILNYFY